MTLMRFPINLPKWRSQNEKKYTEEQIIKALKEYESGVKVDDICRRLGISDETFYNARSKYAGLQVNDAKCLRELESENNKLKKLLAEKSA